MRGILLCRIIWLASLPAVWAVWALAAPAEAAGGPQTLSVTPAIFEQTVDRGKATTHEVVLTNLTSVPLTIRAQPGSFQLREDVAPEYQHIYDTSSWISIKEPEFTLAPAERRSVTFTIAVPAQAEPGGHYATVYFQSLLPGADPNQASISAAPRVGMLAFLTVNGNIVQKAVLAGFKVPRFLEWGPVPVQLKFRNMGNLHLLPAARVKVFDTFGHPVTEVPFDIGFTMPKTTRTYNVSWSGAQPFHRYFLQTEVRYGNQGAKLSTGKVEVWVVPWRLLAFVVLPAAGLIMLLFITRQRWWRAWQAFRKR